MWVLMAENHGRAVLLASFTDYMSADSAWCLLRNQEEEAIWYNGIEVKRDDVEVTFVPLWQDSKVGTRS